MEWNPRKRTFLKIDLDTKDDILLQMHYEHSYWVLDTLNLTILQERFYHTARGFHRMIELKEPLEPIEITLLQALCGSDLRRETFNLVRVLKLSDAPTFWQSRWNVLYAEKLSNGEKKND